MALMVRLFTAYNFCRDAWDTYNAATETVTRYQEIANQNDPVSWGQVLEVVSRVGAVSARMFMTTIGFGSALANNTLSKGITQGGKSVAPSLLKNLYQASEYVPHVTVTGIACEGIRCAVDPKDNKKSALDRAGTHVFSGVGAWAGVAYHKDFVENGIIQPSAKITECLQATANADATKMTAKAIQVLVHEYVNQKNPKELPKEHSPQKTPLDKATLQKIIDQEIRKGHIINEARLQRVIDNCSRKGIFAGEDLLVQAGIINEFHFKHLIDRLSLEDGLVVPNHLRHMLNHQLSELINSYLVQKTFLHGESPQVASQPIYHAPHLSSQIANKDCSPQKMPQAPSQPIYRAPHLSSKILKTDAHIELLREVVVEEDPVKTRFILDKLKEIDSNYFYEICYYLYDLHNAEMLCIWEDVRFAEKAWYGEPGFRVQPQLKLEALALRNRKYTPHKHSTISHAILC